MIAVGHPRPKGRSPTLLSATTGPKRYWVASSAVVNRGYMMVRPYVAHKTTEAAAGMPQEPRRCEHGDAGLAVRAWQSEAEIRRLQWRHPTVAVFRGMFQPRSHCVREPWRQRAQHRLY